MMVLVAVVAMTSCKNVKPDFKFDLHLTGDVSDVPTAINGTLDVKVANYVPTAILSAKLAEEVNADPTDAMTWLETYIQSNVIDQMGPQTTYEINVKGFVHEVNSGITFSVNKTFTNKSEDEVEVIEELVSE